MKTSLRLIGVICLLFVLMIPASVSAEAVKTEVTGILYYYDEDDALRGWQAGNVIQWRINRQYVYIESSDPRFSGWMIEDVSGTAFNDPDGNYLGFHSWSKDMIFSDEARTDQIWECKTGGYWMADNTTEWKKICHGVGANEGLQARVTMWIDLSTWTMRFSGEILDPNGG